MLFNCFVVPVVSLFGYFRLIKHCGAMFVCVCVCMLFFSKRKIHVCKEDVRQVAERSEG